MTSSSVLTATLLTKIVHGVVKTARLPDRLGEQALKSILEPPAAARSLQDWHSVLNDGPFSAHDDSRQVACLGLSVAFLVHQSQCGQPTSTADLDFVWVLIRDALQSPVMQLGLVSVNRSGQGFLAIPLCSIVNDGDIDTLFRLHVWLPDGQRGTRDFEIHSHQPFAQSWVLAGAGKDHAYTVESVSDNSLATHSKYAVAWSSGSGFDSGYKIHQTFSRLVNTGNHVRATPGRTAMHHRGMSYTIPAGAFHVSEVAPDESHATLFLFDASQGFVRDAPVLGPKEADSHTQARHAAGTSTAALVSLVDTTRQREVHLNQARLLSATQ